MKFKSLVVLVVSASTLLAVAQQGCAQATATLTTLYDFTGSGTDGANPYSTLIQGGDGNFYGTTYEGGTQNDGTVFQITPTGVLTTLYSFSGIDGAFPESSLVQGSDGNFYGTTSMGGAYLDGTVFRMTHAGALTVLYSFGSGADDFVPYAGLIQGTDGNFYGTTTGGTVSNGAVFQITPAGALTILHYFAGSDGAVPYAGLVQGSDGGFYGATTAGGPNGSGTVFEITTAGALTTLYSFSALDSNNENSDGAEPYGNLIQGIDDNLYGTTYGGGAGGHGTVFRMTTTGALTTLHAFSGPVNGVFTDGGSPFAGLIQASGGNFYGTTSAGGSNDTGTVFQMTPGGAVTILASLGGGAEIADPSGGLVEGSDGYLYGTTQDGGPDVDGTVFELSLGATGSSPAITSAATAAGTTGKPFSYQIAATNTPTSFGATGLPGGLSVSATGLISGTPTQAGTYLVALSATNGAGTGTATLTLKVASAALPVITLKATVARVTAGDGMDAEFTVTRTGGDLNKALIVAYTVKGSAVAGKDYVSLSGIQKIKAGKKNAVIKVVPLGEGDGAGVGRVVTLLLKASDEYTIGTKAKVKATIIGQ